MALRNQPYLPLYVDDFLSDERLNECSAESTGVYIRLMCLMHKSRDYGTILLKQKDKQSSSTIKNFAVKLVRQMPYSADVIERSLEELLDEDVLTLDGDRLLQRRMVKDAKLSDTRASAGRRGGCSSKTTSTTDDFAGGFAQAKSPANAGNVVVVVNETDTEDGGRYETGIDSPPAPGRVRTREDFAKVVSYYQDKITAMPSSVVISELQDFCSRLPADLCIRAIDIALAERNTRWSYIKGILRNFERDGITSLQELEAREQQRQPPPAGNRGGSPMADLQTLHQMFAAEDEK